METVESSENMALLIVIVLIAILGICIIDLIIDKLKPKSKKRSKKIKNTDTGKKSENTKDIEKATMKIEKMLESIEEDENRIHK